MSEWLDGFSMAWGMFLAIPCPLRRWNEKAREKMLVCLPLVGLAVGGIWLGLYLLLRHAAIGGLYAFLMAALPWLVTGFMHLAGYMDVCDAVLSRRELATRQRILKDSHCGAFAVIGMVLLALCQWSVFLSGSADESLWGLLLIPVAVAYLLCTKSWLGRLLGLLSVGTGCMAMAMTYSRASWVGLALAAVVFVILWNSKLIPLGIVVALVGLALLPDTVFHRILTIFNTSDTSTSSRFPLYRAAAEFLQQRPVLGAGLGSDAVRQSISDLNLFHGKDHFVHCHNIYLQVWCETGLVGLISFVGGILWTAKQGAKAVFHKQCDLVVRMAVIGGVSALLGGLLCGMADYLWNYPRVMLIFWFTSEPFVFT